MSLGAMWGQVELGRRARAAMGLSWVNSGLRVAYRPKFVGIDCARIAGSFEFFPASSSCT